MIHSAGISDHPPDFRFERGPGFPYWTLGYFLRGHIHNTSRGIQVDTVAYDLSCMKPDTPYRTCMAADSEAWHGLWFIFTPREDWLPLLAFPEPVRGLGHLSLGRSPLRHRIRRLVQSAHDLHHARSPHASLHAMHALEAALLLVAEATGGEGRSALDQRILAAAETLGTDLKHPIGIAGLARTAKLSPSRFAHLFTRTMGVSPMLYREQRRMREARALLMGNECSIQDLARALGFDSPFHFSKRFKHHHGLAPRHFRQRMYTPGFLEQWED